MRVRKRAGPKENGGRGSVEIRWVRKQKKATTVDTRWSKSQESAFVARGRNQKPYKIKQNKTKSLSHVSDGLNKTCKGFSLIQNYVRNFPTLTRLTSNAYSKILPSESTSNTQGADPVTLQSSPFATIAPTQQSSIVNPGLPPQSEPPHSPQAGLQQTRPSPSSTPSMSVLQVVVVGVVGAKTVTAGIQTSKRVGGKDDGRRRHCMRVAAGSQMIRIFVVYISGCSFI